MAVFNKFDSFVAEVAKGTHVGALTADTDTLRVYLSNAQPVSMHQVKADLAEITNEHGYTAPVDVQNAVSQVGSVITVVGTDLVIEAVGGTIGPFQHLVLFNDTPISPIDPLIGWWTYPTPITLLEGESLTVDFGAALFRIGG